jgi:hypothetical protein
VFLEIQLPGREKLRDLPEMAGDTRERRAICYLPMAMIRRTELHYPLRAPARSASAIVFPIGCSGLSWLDAQSTLLKDYRLGPDRDETELGSPQ